MADEPKNLIILTSDEMRGDCPSFMGNPDCRTPSLDRFAERSVAFKQHFTVHGKCVPSRASLLTGRYCHTEGYRSVEKDNRIHPHEPDIAKKLKSLGYELAMFGHNHEWTNLTVANKKSDGLVDYHSYTEEYFDHMLEREWPAPEPEPGAPEPPVLSQAVFHYSGRITRPIKGFCDHNRAMQAVEYLTNVRDRSRPFYLHVNLSRPHPAYQVEEPFFSMYDRDRIRHWPYTLPDGAPLHMRKMREVRSGFDAPEECFREIQAVYYGMITRVDDQLGWILDAIEREGLFENSVVMFWVDHGDFAGQYGLPEKWDTCMADCILHVPQILCAPQLPRGVSVDSLTEHTDLAPTILELLEVHPDWGIHGESLMPIIRGEKRKEAVFADGGHERAAWDRRFQDRTEEEKRQLNGKQRTYLECPESMARAKMVRTDRWKLVVRLAGGNELYDMANDPYEMKNLWGRPECDDVVRDLQLKLIEWCLRTDTDRPPMERVYA